MDDRGNLPREECEASDDEPETDESERRPRVRKKRPFVGEGIGQSYFFAHIRQLRFSSTMPVTRLDARCKRAADDLARRRPIAHCDTALLN